MSDWSDEYRPLWDGLSPAARDTLRCLCERGPTWDGDLPSKRGRDELLSKNLAAKIVLAKSEYGYQAATYLGARAYRAGVTEPRKETVRKLVGPEHVKP